jgi:hypothetical protein
MTNNFWIWFWTLMIFGSIAWYGILLFIIGFKGGREVIQMAQNLSRAHESSSKELD